MKPNLKENTLESLENQSNVVALSDVDRAGNEDWLTPMNRLSKFVVKEKDAFRATIYLNAYTKVINHEYCVELMEHSVYNDERTMYVFAVEFCKKYQLVEIVDEYTGTV